MTGDDDLLAPAFAVLERRSLSFLEIAPAVESPKASGAQPVPGLPPKAGIPPRAAWKAWRTRPRDSHRPARGCWTRGRPGER